MKNTRKGFTITELVIVIVVIAILAAVLIPTFSNLIKKANMSADQQAVRQMNTILAAEGAVEKNDIFDVFDALAEAGFSAENYKPLTANTYFFWDAELDRVLYVDAEMKVLFPKEYEDLDYTGRTWLSLTQKIVVDSQIDGYKDGDATVTVTNANELAYIVEQARANNIADGLEINLGGKDLDMMGASLNMANAAKGEVTKNFTVKNGTLKNVSVVDAANHSTVKKPGEDGRYNAGGLFGKISGKTVTIENVVIENINVQNTHVSGAALLVANSQNATINIKNVTIKNSTVVAHRNAGALIGYVGGGTTVNMSGNIKLENVHVKTIGGRSAMLIGYCDGTLNDSSNIALTNCTYGMYACEQNSGTSPKGDPLGLQANGALYSWCLDGTGEYDYNTDKFFDKTALIMVRNAGEILNVAKNDLFNNVTGW